MNTEQLTKQITESYNNHLENVIIEGLKLKGYSFENRNDLLKFVQKNVGVAETGTYVKTYYVNETPFLQHDYSPKIDLDIENTKITSNFGIFKYL